MRAVLSIAASFLLIEKGDARKGYVNCIDASPMLLRRLQHGLRVLAERGDAQRGPARFVRETDRRIQMTMSVGIGQQHAARVDMRVPQRLAVVEYRHGRHAAGGKPGEPVIERALAQALRQKLAQRVLRRAWFAERDVDQIRALQRVEQRARKARLTGAKA